MLELNILKLLVDTVRLLMDLGEKIQVPARARSLSRSIVFGHYTEEQVRDTVTTYVEPDFGNVDPTAYQEPSALTFVAREPVQKKIVEAIDTRRGARTRFALVLADSGMGKTSLMLSACHWISARRGVSAQVLALNRDGIEDIIAGIPDDKAAATVLLLDGLDEDPKAEKNPDARLTELLALSARFRATIVSSRTQFFTSTSAIPKEIVLAPIGPRSLLKGEASQIEHMFLMPFNERQIDAFIRKRYGVFAVSKRRKAMRLISRVPDLSARPMLLGYLDALSAEDSGEITTSSIYQKIVDAWLERESYWARPAELYKFSLVCAVELYARRAKDGGLSAEREQLQALAINYGIELREYQFGARSLLNKDAVGHYKFAHRSILEHLLVRAAFTRIAGHNWVSVDLTDQMRKFLFDRRQLNVSGQPWKLGRFHALALDQVSTIRHLDMSFDWTLFPRSRRLGASEIKGIWSLQLSHGQNQKSSLEDLLLAAVDTAAEPTSPRLE